MAVNEIYFRVYRETVWHYESKERLDEGSHGLQHLKSCFVSFDIPSDLPEHIAYSSLLPECFPLSQAKNHYVDYGDPEIEANLTSFTRPYGSNAWQMDRTLTSFKHLPWPRGLRRVAFIKTDEVFTKSRITENGPSKPFSRIWAQTC